MLESSVRKLYDCPQLIVAKYQCHKLPRICSVCRNHNPTLTIPPLQSRPFLIHDLSRVCYQSNTAGGTSVKGTAYHSGAPEFITVFSGSCCSMFSVSFISTIVCLFVLCSAIVLSVFLHFAQPLCCLSFCTLFSHCVVCLFVLCSAIVLSVFLYFVQPLYCLSFFE